VLAGHDDLQAGWGAGSAGSEVQGTCLSSEAKLARRPPPSAADAEERRPSQTERGGQPIGEATRCCGAILPAILHIACDSILQEREWGW
jgi:hypothetical protein